MGFHLYNRTFNVVAYPYTDNIVDYGTTTPVSVDINNCYGDILTNADAGGDTHFDLPAAKVGMRVTFCVVVTQTITIDPSGTERIVVVTDTNGDYLRSDAIVGSYVVLICLKDGEWSVLNYAGVWTEQ